jgi:hypothetical protein
VRVERAREAARAALACGTAREAEAVLHRALDDELGREP